MRRFALLSVILAAALALLTLAVLPSCATARAPLPPAPTNDLARPSVAPQPEATTNDAASRQREADARVAKIEGDLAEARRIAAQEHEAARQARLDGIRRVVDWACAVAALAGIVGTGVAVMLRSKLLALVPVASAAMVAFGLTTNVIIDHPWLTAGGLAAIVAVVALVPTLRHRAQMLAAAT